MEIITTAQKAKGNKMANYNTETLVDLASEAMVKSIATKPITETTPTTDATPCKDNDKACTKRWIDSFSDCC